MEDFQRRGACRANQWGLPWQKRCQIFSQLALEKAEKNHVGVGGGFDLEFTQKPLGLSSGRSGNFYKNRKRCLPQRKLVGTPGMASS